MLVNRLVLVLAFVLLLPLFSAAQERQPALSSGQLLYIPSYSRTATGASKRVYPLSVTLSVHNVDPARSIRLSEVDYYSTTGELLKKYLDGPVNLRPLETREFVIREIDNPGGSGDNFLVRWYADEPVNPPLVESVFLGTASGQGISLTSRGVVIVE